MTASSRSTLEKGPRSVGAFHTNSELGGGAMGVTVALIIGLESLGFSGLMDTGMTLHSLAALSVCYLT